MKLTDITVNARRLNRNTACWEASLKMGSLHTFMSDTLTRPRGDVMVTAELAAIWTALQEIKGFHWIEINASPSTAAVLSHFLRHELPEGYQTAYRHFEYFLRKHNFLIGSTGRPQSTYFVPIMSRICKLNPELRSRALRAAQLVTIGAVSRHPVSGFQCWSKTHPLHPYRIIRSKTGEWSCTCPDDSPPMLTDSQPVCKHLLAAMMTARLRQSARFPLYPTS